MLKCILSNSFWAGYSAWNWFKFACWTHGIGELSNQSVPFSFRTFPTCKMEILQKGNNKNSALAFEVLEHKLYLALIINLPQNKKKTSKLWTVLEIITSKQKKNQAATSQGANILGPYFVLNNSMFEQIKKNENVIKSQSFSLIKRMNNTLTLSQTHTNTCVTTKSAKRTRKKKLTTE